MLEQKIVLCKYVYILFDAFINTHTLQKAYTCMSIRRYASEPIVFACKLVDS